MIMNPDLMRKLGLIRANLQKQYCQYWFCFNTQYQAGGDSLKIGFHQIFPRVYQFTCVMVYTLHPISVHKRPNKKILSFPVTL